jgi:predicted dinucleotide-binding enzyme
MKIAVIGAGRMGGTLGSIFARAGHDVTFSYSRHEHKLRDIAAQTGHNVRSATPAEAVQDADLVLLSVHWLQVDDALTQAGSLDGKTVMTCCNPLNADDTELVIAHTSSGAEALAQKIPGAHVVAAFQTTPSELLRDVFEARNNEQRPSLLFCGDNTASNALVANLISQTGFDPVNAGALSVARYIEPFGMLSGVLAYGTDQGPQWAYRLGRFDRLIK